MKYSYYLHEDQLVQRPSVSGSVKVPPFLAPLPRSFTDSIFASFLHTSFKVSRSPLHSRPHCVRLPARKHASAGRRRPLINGRRVRTRHRARRPVPRGDYVAVHAAKEMKGRARQTKPLLIINGGASVSLCRQSTQVAPCTQSKLHATPSVSRPRRSSPPPCWLFPAANLGITPTAALKK